MILTEIRIKWPFNLNHYLILNLAVGGDWGGVQGIDQTQFPMEMEVDYVRVYEKTESGKSIKVKFQVDMKNEMVSGTGSLGFRRKFKFIKFSWYTNVFDSRDDCLGN